jgi:tetratricopeptide (TPR) repeat protein
MQDYKYFLDNGIFDFQNGKYNDAIDKINKSLEIKKDWAIPYFYRGACFHAIGEYDEAMLDYTKAIQLDENMTDAYYNRARITLSRKDLDNPKIENAVKDLEKALELDDKFVDALYAMAAAKKKLGDYHAALVYIERLLQIEPDAIWAKALKKLILQKYIV